MPETIACQKCLQTIDPLTTRFADMIRSFAEDGHDEMAIECPHCEKYTKFNPVAFMQGQPSQPSVAPCRCPVSACAGYVSFVTDTDDGTIPKRNDSAV